MEVKCHDVLAHDTHDGQAKRVRVRSENFPGYQGATQFSGIFTEIPGWLVGMHVGY